MGTRECFTKEVIFDLGERERENERERKSFTCVANSAPNYKFSSSHSNFATGDVFFSFFSRKKNSHSIFIIEIAICHSQGALVPLSLPSAGSSVAKNSWQREPLATH